MSVPRELASHFIIRRETLELRTDEGQKMLYTAWKWIEWIHSKIQLLIVWQRPQCCGDFWNMYLWVFAHPPKTKWKWCGYGIFVIRSCTSRWPSASSSVSPHLPTCAALPWLHLSLCPWRLEDTPSASGQRTWTEGISHYVTALLLLLPAEPRSSVSVWDSGEERETGPRGAPVMGTDPAGFDTSSRDFRVWSVTWPSAGHMLSWRIKKKTPPSLRRSSALSSSFLDLLTISPSN